MIYAALWWANFPDGQPIAAQAQAPDDRAESSPPPFSKLLRQSLLPEMAWHGRSLVPICLR